MTYANELLNALKEFNVNTPIIMGGLLNENQDGSSLAIDVKKDHEKMGIISSISADMIISKIKGKID